MDLDVPAASAATQITVLKIVSKMAHNGPNINFSLVLICMLKTKVDELQFGTLAIMVKKMLSNETFLLIFQHCAKWCTTWQA